MPAPSTAVAESVDLLVALAHHDPHSFLGAHTPDDGSAGTIVRVFRPGASPPTIVVGKREIATVCTDERGLFEATIKRARSPISYLVRDAESGVAIADPYTFLPTVGELDTHLFAEGRHRRLGHVLGAHRRESNGVTGTAFVVWAPSARGVSVAGDFNGWDPRSLPMRTLGGSGLWELFVPGAQLGDRYKYAVHARNGSVVMHADPVAARTEVPPENASIVFEPTYEWHDDEWIAQRAAEPFARPMSIYEVHAGSWRLGLDWRALAHELADHVTDLGFTHVELLPVMEHPFAGSWGYQVTGFFASTARFGSPDDFRELVDIMHARGIGVILDWVPAHFPRDEWALARFDGTALYEHDDPRRGAHPDWGTLIFNYGRNEVRNFLLASAATWVRDFHVDALRVDAVASMLYLDYSRNPGEWIPNALGGREDFDAIELVRELNDVVAAEAPGTFAIAEESTAWSGVSRPVDEGGLGFRYKWNMGWMHDTLEYFSREAIYRRFHHHELTFSMVYAYSEHYVLPLSHDEVVHGKRSLLGRMPGDRWQQLANLRALYAYMWAHPGKKLLFMGGELAQEREWSHERSLDWELRDLPGHAGVESLVRDLNHLYRRERALWAGDDDPSAFAWLESNDADHNVYAFARFDPAGGRPVAFAVNLSPVPRYDYRLALPEPGEWEELLDTDSSYYGGSDVGNGGVVHADGDARNGQPCSARLALPPLGAVLLAPRRPPSA
ncbi:MAG TPA: 1,4-alpha-glucan branching protein GlgB [Acidimicrobiia bacterium]|nr:1,4-alpha-glucan branching protein GlgB [Acidimicrobiia bacterium]